MSRYHEICQKCEDETITHGWSPEKCPFCELAEITKQRDALAEALREYRKILRDGPENCSYKMYEAADAMAQAAIADLEGGVA